MFAEPLVGLRLHVVGDDADVEVGVGIVLSYAGVDGIDDNAVLIIGGIEDEEIVVMRFLLRLSFTLQITGQSRIFFLAQHGDKGKEEYIGSGSC